MPDQSHAVTRVLMVFPRFNANSFWNFAEACEVKGAKAAAPPLGLITVAALLPEHWSTHLINRNTGDLTDDDIRGADVVFTGGMLPQERDTMEIIRMCRRLGVPVAVGGPSATSTPEMYEEADFVVGGEAEGIIGEFVAAWERGERSGRLMAPKFQADVTKTPIPRYDLLKFSDYLFVGVQFSRGCPFTCEFCDIIELYGRVPRTKTTPQMLAELDRLMALGYRGHVDFVDDNLIGNKKAVKAFLPHLIEWQKARGYPFKFTTEASLNLSDDQELLGLMAKANFFLVFCGIESPDEETLVATSKKQNTRRSISESVHRIYDAGIAVTAGFIIGFDTEKGSISKPMTGCISDTAVPLAVVGLLTALPNTQLSRRLRKEGRLFKDFTAHSEDPGDASTAGLNFTTLRPRREILLDFRETVAAVYAPDAFFARVRTVGRKLGKQKLPELKVNWRLAAYDLRSFLRTVWRINTRHPELARHFWGTLWETARHNPRALEVVVTNIIVYLHLYPFSRYVVGEIDGALQRMESGRFVEPLPLPAPANSDVTPDFKAGKRLAVA
ncbi:B12-binding domain-containing radical SAM protein [Methylobacterium haplocladii]|uniref:B12-binding domain-containing radical SAM protein n=1 Tax=Methylobacterium haplocladii TaxID=1176176 RepID=A0A512INW3_9HYPH|nr:B12-binding domain-containing radical SAM protein [Methylobacterium haplocladii]GEO99406.1 B12-binding domain-containing radical SAM protein [Methylobacterium haplocladii]GJD83234.1 hypothetical protein HPGCJGGD_1100 [Methylobacterium haplocladii]GLS60628.1 B12-binding domain-containing radical SAM protein [Methylobacterium haplocladii]